MRRNLHILILLLLVAFSCRGPQRIPREEMEDIFYQMLIQDQQIKQDRNLKRQADTSLVYEGIFESYGYTTDDFIFSLDYYLEDASRMEKVMENVVKRLEGDASLSRMELDHERWRDALLHIYAMTPDTASLPQRVRLVDTLLIRFDADSVHAVLPPRDTLPQPHPDSLLFVRDSL